MKPLLSVFVPVLLFVVAACSGSAASPSRVAPLAAPSAAASAATPAPSAPRPP